MAPVWFSLSVTLTLGPQRKQIREIGSYERSNWKICPSLAVLILVKFNDVTDARFWLQFTSLLKGLVNSNFHF